MANTLDCSDRFVNPRKVTAHVGFDPINELTEKAEHLEDEGKLDEALEFWRAAIQRESACLVVSFPPEDVVC